MSKKIFFVLVILIVIFIILSNLDSDNQGKDNLKTVRSDSLTYSNNWGPSIPLGLNSNLWEDGMYVSGDGLMLYYVVYPGEDLINDSINNDYKGDIDIYYSEYPFSEGKKHRLSEKPWSEGGVMISGNDIYYMSNKPVNSQDVIYDTNIYRNKELLSFNSNESMDDPHYCDKKNELYFWNSDEIYVFKNNKVEKLPSPINDGEENIQPFLTSDCQTIYFSSRRDSDNVLKIYKSKRLNNNDWGEIMLVISGEHGVGEPTLTDDEKKLFFTQVFRSNDGKYSTDLYYVIKK